MIKIENMLVPLSHYRKWLIPFQDEKTREFIRKARLVHGNRYDYRYAKYINNREKIIIYCNKCNKYFLQSPKDHLKNYGCLDCSKQILIEKQRKLFGSNTLEFIKKSKEIHGDKYDYSEVNYINNQTKVKIYCKEHDVFFWQTPLNHLKGKCGCEKCKEEKKLLISQKRTFNNSIFIEKAIKIHGDKYDYSEVNYVNSQTKVKIFCKKHKEFFWQAPHSHLQGRGCERCGREEVGKQNKCSKESILERLIDLYGDEYDFSKIDFSANFHTPVEIICPIHGPFYRTLNNLLFEPFNKCCPQCNERFVCESIVGEWIKEHNITFQRHYKLINVIKLVDIVEIDYRVIYNEIIIFIEYNGIQHYEFHEFFHRGDVEKFKDQLRRDEKVRAYCKSNNICLIEIPYTINNKKDIFKFLNDVIIGEKDPKSLVNYESLFKRPSDYVPYSEIENKDN